MRVIAGKAKGRKLKAPKLSRGRRIRPLSDQAKESLYNILGASVIDASFLDLFAGTGSVGIEALSRGAKLAIFIELDKHVVRTLRDNLQMTELSECAEVYSVDAQRGIKILGSKGAKFDIIFIGAPYGSPVLIKVLEEISNAKLLNDSGVVVAEHSKNIELAPEIKSLKKFRDAKYGDTVLSFYGFNGVL